MGQVRKIGRTELETEGLIVSLIQQRGLPLVFHRATRRYLHPQRLQAACQVVDRCPQGGAHLGAQVVFAGELLHCQYCEHPLSAGLMRDRGAFRGTI